MRPRTSLRTFSMAAVILAAPLLGRADLLPIKSYTVADGLAQNTINRITRDKRGFLWFCTAEGLSRFDGYTFTNYGTHQGLPHRFVSDFLETRAGEYWVATYGGLARFNPKGTPSGSPPMFTSVIQTGASAARFVTAVREGRDGTIWVGTMGGLYRLQCSGSQCSLIPVDIEQHEVEDLIEDRGGDLWIATAYGLYRRWPDGRMAHYTTRDGLPDDYLHCLLKDSRGQLWVGSRNSGIFRLDAMDSPVPHVAETLIHIASDGQKTTWIYQLIERSDGTLWAATNRGILEVVSGATSRSRLRAFGTRNGLTGHEITALTEDATGNLWLGTSSAGAMKLARGGFISYGEADGLVGVNAIFGDRQGGVCFRAYVIGDGRRSVFEGAKLDPLRSFDKYMPRFGRFDGERLTWLLPEAIHKEWVGWVGERVTLQTRSGEWWIGTAAGVYRFPAVSFPELKKARPIAIYRMPQVFRLFEDSHGDIWISTTTSAINSLARWDHTTGMVRDAAGIPGLEPARDDLARSFGEDAAGNMWIGFGQGLARYRDGRFTFFTAKDGLPRGGVNDIHLDHAARLWLASSASGVIRVDHVDAASPSFRKYTTANGLSSDVAEVLTEDSRGQMYVGTGRGLDRLDPETGRIRHFTVADGLAPGRFLAAFCDRKGTLWFGTQKGLSRLSADREDRTAAPEILINGVSVAGSRHNVSALGENDVVLPDLPPFRNQLQFDFAALNFAVGQTLKYQYKLEGGSTSEWSTPSDQRTINYANLTPARYKFRVRAINSDGMVSPTPATVTFTILPHVWQRWWFVSMMILAIGLGAYAAYRYRINRIVEVANIRAHIAADLHDDIGANLTRIAILSEVAKRQLGGDENGPLPSIARISRESVAAMSDIVWAINPDRDTLVDLVRRMRRHAEELFASGSATLSFSASDADENLKLGAVLRRDFFLVFKEAINNAARHSRCSRMEIVLCVEGQWLLLRVADNGVGFDSDMESTGQGLSSMRRRARKMGGFLTFESQPGLGTTVLLRVPYVNW